MDLSGKKALVIGLGKSGVGAANLLLSAGAEVTVSDGKPEQDVKTALQRIHGDVHTILGRNPSVDDIAKVDLIVPSPAVPADAPFLNAARERGVKVWSEIELASRFCRADIIGITGTNGKTTTTTLVGEIAGKVWPGSMAAGNIGIAFTEVCADFPAGAVAALELSSFQLETIDGFKPHISAILNFTPDHLDRHHTYENYVAAKCRVYEYQTAQDFVVLNFDDPLVRQKGMAIREKAVQVGREEAVGVPTVVFFSRTEVIDDGIYLDGHSIVAGPKFPVSLREARAADIVESSDGAADAAADGCTFLADVDKMQIFGPHNEENAMAALACLLLEGAPLDKVQEGLYAFKGVAHRIEYVGTVDGVAYYNDSKATNPDAAIKGILAMKSKDTVLIGGGYDKGTPFDSWVQLFEGRVSKLILLGQTAAKILDCCHQYGFAEEKIQMVETFEEAIQEARKAAKPGDSVLLSPACASWGMFKNYEQRGDLFRAMVQQMAEEKGA